MHQNGQNNKILNAVIVLIFLVLTLYVGYYHEPWADEAQSWLIARDATVSEIIFKIARYEGTPSLWHLTLKIFIMFGFQYEYFYLISILFSVIGVWIIVYKLKIPNIFKIMLPFTYFIFYEYTIKARSYCLLLPVLAGIAWIYENRKTKVFLYNFLLGILATICLHGAIISGILYLFEVFDVIKKVKENGNIIECKKEIISIILLTILYFCIIGSVYPPPDIYVNVTIANINAKSIFRTILYCIVKILEAFILGFNAWMICILPALIFLIYIFVCILKGNKNKKIFLTLFISIALFICLIRITNHHLGLITYTFLFALYLVKNNIKEKNKKILNILLTFIFIVQIIWACNSIKTEVNYTYSASKAVAEYLQKLNYKDLDIYATGYYSTSILPYFENNIFDNDRGGKTYYLWSRNNLDWHRASSKEYIYPENTGKEPDIIIMHDNYSGDGYMTLMNKIRDEKKYKETHFNGNAIFKGNIIKYKTADDEGFYVFERIK